MPSWAPLLLGALFRYSEARDAWILRGIGEKYGPVLVPTAPRQLSPPDPPPPRLGRWLGRPPPVAWRLSPQLERPPARVAVSPRVLGIRASVLALGLAAAVTLASAAGGFTVARSSSHAGTRTKLDAYASAGPLRVLFPSVWRGISPPSGLPLNLTDEIAAAPSASSGGMLVVGRTVASNPELLPPSLLATLPAVPLGSVVRLGGTTFYRYLDVSPRGYLGPDAVYAVPTTAGVVLGVCVMRGAPAAFLSSCERSLATLRLSQGTVLPPGPIPAYASALNLTIERLNQVRAGVGKRLLHASGAKVEATLANRLAAAHARAAKALQHLNAGAANAANLAVVAALEHNSAAYRALGEAASRQDPAAYDAARALVRRASRAWQAAFSRLAAFGYG